MGPLTVIDWGCSKEHERVKKIPKKRAGILNVE
jgi:hypothetical protein